MAPIKALQRLEQVSVKHPATVESRHIAFVNTGNAPSNYQLTVPSSPASLRSLSPQWASSPVRSSPVRSKSPKKPAGGFNPRIEYIK